MTRSAELAQAVEAVCVSAGVELSITETAESMNSPVLLIDAQLANDQTPAHALVVGLNEQPGLWDAAAQCGARAVVILPQAAPWLAETLSRTVSAPGERAAGSVVGIVGAVGGVGASTFSCWLAQHLSQQNQPTALVDMDPYAVGIDLVLGVEEQDGLRWPELRQFSGAIAGDQLWAALPHVDSLRYLSWDRCPTDVHAVPTAAVLGALRQAAAWQVLDLDRSALEEQASWCDLVILVTPRTVRGVLAAAHALTRMAGTRVVSVLAGLDVADVDAAVIQSATDVTCIGTLGFDARIPQSLDNGTVLRRGHSGANAKAVKQIAQAVGELL